MMKWFYFLLIIPLISCKIEIRDDHLDTEVSFDFILNSNVEYSVSQSTPIKFITEESGKISISYGQDCDSAIWINKPANVDLYADDADNYISIRYKDSDDNISDCVTKNIYYAKSVLTITSFNVPVDYKKIDESPIISYSVSHILSYKTYIQIEDKYSSILYSYSEHTSGDNVALSGLKRGESYTVKLKVVEVLTGRAVIDQKNWILNFTDDFDSLTLNSHWSVIDLDDYDADSDGDKTNDSFYSFFNGDLSLVSRGADVWGTTHEYVSLYFEKDDDFDFYIEMKSMTNPNTWAKSGLIISNDMENLNLGGLAFCVQTPGSNMVIQHSVADAGNIDGNTSSGNNNVPKFIRMKKENDFIHCYYKENEIDSWTEFNGSPVQKVFTSIYHVGIMQTSHNTGRDLVTEISKFVDISN